MGVRIRKWKGAWWLFITHQGHRRAKRVGDRKSAELAAIKIRSRLADGDVTPLNPSAPAERVPTFGEIAASWLTRYPALHAVRPGTMENYASFLQRHLVPYLGTMAITDIGAAAIEDFIEAKRAPGGSVRLKGKPLGDNAIAVGLIALRLILQRAVRLKLIPSNPMNDVEWTRAPRVVRADPFTTSELRSILRAAHAIDPDFAALLRVWAQSGMRAGEVCGLQGQDLDLEKGTALVRRTWTRERIGPTKTGGERVVSLLHPVADAVPDWRPGAGDSRAVLAALRALRVQALDPGAFAFTRAGVPWASQTLNPLWRRVLATAHVRYRFPEQLRHTFASTLLSRNAPLLYVQQQGGWRSAAVLLRTYSRWLPQDAGIVAPPSAQAKRGERQP